MSDETKSTYARTWDRYVTEMFPEAQAHPHRDARLHDWQVLNRTDAAYRWPGEEWGDRAAVERILETCVFGRLDAAARHFCEIGSGAGRFTEQVLHRYPQAGIDCFDVSSAFLDQMRERFAAEAGAGRLRTHLLTRNPRFLFTTLGERSLVGEIDCLFSFDAAVHIDLHTLVVYFATAAAALRPGGLLTMNVADATSERGFQKLLFNAPSAYTRGGDAGTQFQFMSPDIMAGVLSRLGFAVEFHDCNGRDLFFTATLADPDRAGDAFARAGSDWFERLKSGAGG